MHPVVADSVPQIALRDVIGSLVGAVALAVSHPTLDLLSRNLTFFTAHQAVPLDVLGIAVLIAIAIPIVVSVPVAILMRLVPGVGIVAYVVVLCLFTAAAVLPFVERVTETSWIVVVVALAFGGVVVWACLRVPVLQTLLRWGAVVPGLVLGLFVLASPASALVIAPDSVMQETSGVGNPVPIVVLVLDELPVQSLMDAHGDIDATRYPGFASLLDDFTWYRNTATMHHYTANVLPTILTGVPYQPDLEPSSVGYPNNLFSLVERSHDVWAHEEATDMCGPDVCRDRQYPDATERWQLLISDTGIVAAHVALPTGATRSLPPLDGAWTGFGSGEAAYDASEPTQTEGEAAVFDAFLDSLRSVGPRPLRFLHYLDPHFPWHALPGGLRYPGLIRPKSEGGQWVDDQWVIDLKHQSHMLQTGYVDSQLVRFLEMVRDTSWYDDALIMVMADHGIAFTANGYIRAGTEENIDEIAYVPLFVKTPGQFVGRVDDRPASLFDVLPTIVDVLEVESSWQMKGVSLLDEHPDRSRRRVFDGVSVIDLPPNPEMEDEIARKAALFGSGEGWDPVYSYGPYRDLAGRAVETLVREPESAAVEIVDGALYDRVDPETGVVPALVRASVSSAHVTSETWLAVALNGSVAATGRVHDWTPEGADFTVIVPPSSFVTGVNDIALYRIEDTDEGPVLHHLENN